MAVHCFLELLNAIGPVAVALVVLIVTWRFYRWQVRLAKQKLRHDLYKRRLAIYVAFRKLLSALIDKNKDEIVKAFRRASSARFEARFLLDDYSKIKATLEALWKEVDDDVMSYIRYSDAVKPQSTMNDPQTLLESTQRADRFGHAKLDIADRYFEELPKQFEKALNLTDFWKDLK
jgi:hypothetical protein